MATLTSIVVILAVLAFLMISNKYQAARLERQVRIVRVESNKFGQASKCVWRLDKEA